MKKTLLSGLLSILLLLTIVPAKADTCWEETTIESSRVYALIYDPGIESCTSFRIHLDVTMKHGARCKNWVLWLRENGKYVRTASIILPDGTGQTEKLITLKEPLSFDAVAVTPSAYGSFSYSLDMTVTDINADTEAFDDSSELGDYLPGGWEEVVLPGSEYTDYAYVLTEPLTQCSGVTIDVYAELFEGARCGSWTIWGRIDGSFEQIGTLLLEDGFGAGSACVYFDTPVDIDAFVLTPDSEGSFSWTLAIGILASAPGDHPAADTQ